MECYIVYTGYEEFKLAPTLKEAISIKRTNYDNPADAYSNSSIYFENSSGNREEVNLQQFIKQVELTKEQLQEIDNRVEKEIKNTEETLKTMFAGMKPGAMITGYFGITRDRKEWAVQNEIKNASFVWDEEKIDNLSN